MTDWKSVLLIVRLAAEKVHRAKADGEDEQNGAVGSEHRAAVGPPIFRLLYGLHSASCGNRAFEQDFHCKRSKDSLAMILPSMILPALRFSASKSEPISLVYVTFIRTTPEKLREALTNGDFSDKQPEEPA